MRTYRAAIKGSHIEWRGRAPDVPADHVLNVEVTVLGPPNDGDHRRAMAAILEEIAAGGGLVELDDAATWQREIRQDRELPGREA